MFKLLSLVLVFLAGLVCCEVGWGAEPTAPELFRQARSAMAGREMVAAEQTLATAAEQELTAEQAAELARLQAIHQHLGQFWQAVDRGARSLNATEELVIDGKRVSVVEFANGRLVIRSEGRNLRYTAQTVPGKIVLTLAERTLDPKSPENLLGVAAFLLMDGKGKRDLAEQITRRAAAAGVNVSALQAELDVAPVAPPIAIPPLTPLGRQLLKADNWSLRQVTQGRAVRQPLEQAANTPEGYLQVTGPAGGEQAVMVFSRRLTTNFGCRLIVKDAVAGQAFALVDAEGADALCQVPLPGGTCKIEFARVRGEWQCRVNDEAVAVAADAATRRQPCLLGVTLKPGETTTVAWLELQGS